ncbi:MAG TPA: sigma-70 family RNA polymerase sigma factor [Gemmatimonadaceae bacterium]|jgi:RNA polymerase sigma-70 factor (ECF subfamily)|nr:sigma-70 family RNA polymerase sigma factor [Gemmatimonadaceae bacterium]
MPTPETDQDAALVARLRQGDEHAFRVIWDSYHGRLIEFVYRYVLSYDVAADIVQSVFFVLWSERETVTPRTTLVSHLYGAARFRALRELKHARVEQAYEATVDTEDDSELRVAWNSGESAVEHDEVLKAVQTAIEGMTPRVREIFLLHWEDEFTAPQIAAALEIKVQVVYNQLSRALKIVAAATSHLRDP